MWARAAKVTAGVLTTTAGVVLGTSEKAQNGAKEAFNASTWSETASMLGDAAKDGLKETVRKMDDAAQRMEKIAENLTGIDFDGDNEDDAHISADERMDGHGRELSRHTSSGITEAFQQLRDGLDARQKAADEKKEEARRKYRDKVTAYVVEEDSSTDTSTSKESPSENKTSQEDDNKSLWQYFFGGDNDQKDFKATDTPSKPNRP